MDINQVAGGKKFLLVVLSVVFMVAMSYLYGMFLAFPVACYLLYAIPEVFASFGQAFLVMTFAFGLLFLIINGVSRFAQACLKNGHYLQDTFFYDFVAH